MSILAALSLAAAPVPALPEDNWDKIKHLEIAYQVANMADLATTIYVLESGKGHELNPLVGKHPSTEKLVAVKVGGGIVHYFLMKELAKRNVKIARWMEYITIGFTSGVVASNLTVAF